MRAQGRWHSPIEPCLSRLGAPLIQGATHRRSIHPCQHRRAVRCRPVRTLAALDEAPKKEERAALRWAIMEAIVRGLQQAGG